MALERVEANLDLMITLKDALQHFENFLQGRIAECGEAAKKLPGFITQIEKLVAQETGLIQEMSSVRDKLSQAKEQQESLQGDLAIVNELESLEERIREKETAREDLMRRLQVGRAIMTEGTKLLDLDIEALAEYRSHQLDLLKQRDVDRKKVRPILDSLEKQEVQLTREYTEREDKIREIGATRQELTREFADLKALDSERRQFEISFDNLQQLTEIVGEISLDVDTIQTEVGAQVEEGVVQC